MTAPQAASRAQPCLRAAFPQFKGSNTAFVLPFVLIVAIIAAVKLLQGRLLFALPAERKGGCVMDTNEVLTLILVIFAALTYIDSHKK